MTAITVEEDRIPEPATYRQSEMEPGRDAWQLLEQVWLIHGPGRILLPVDPIELAEKIGVVVLMDDELQADVSAVLRKEPGFRDPLILLNVLEEVDDRTGVASLAARFAVTGDVMRARLDRIGWRR